jgi:hypothetical protein
MRRIFIVAHGSAVRRLYELHKAERLLERARLWRNVADKLMDVHGAIRAWLALQEQPVTLIGFKSKV